MNGALLWHVTGLCFEIWKLELRDDRQIIYVSQDNIKNVLIMFSFMIHIFLYTLTFHVRFECLMALTVKITVFWDMTSNLSVQNDVEGVNEEHRTWTLVCLGSQPHHPSAYIARPLLHTWLTLLLLSRRQEVSSERW